MLRALAVLDQDFVRDDLFETEVNSVKQRSRSVGLIRSPIRFRE